MSDYYKILNLSKKASIDDLKHAYRKLAYEYHPDVSKLSNSRELFIELNEAYEYLLNKLKLEQELKNRKSPTYEETAQSIIDSWIAGERERIRKRAGIHANMKFSHFKKTKIYRTTEILNKYLNITMLLFGFIVFFGALIGTWQKFNSDSREINFTNIGGAFLAGILGIVMTSYSVYKIRSDIKSDKF